MALRERFITKNFRQASLILIQQANEIIAEYQDQGYDLTLRQLYYQFVSRDLIPNTKKSYKNLGNVISDGRLAGLIDWNSIVDRTRNRQVLPHWDKASDIIGACARQFQVNKWENQNYRPEVWIEKEALIGVVERVCDDRDVPYFACRGYNSQSEQYRAGKRFEHYLINKQIPVVIHLGDHDPSGIDMTRDNFDRLMMFAEYPVEVRRIALNMNQVDEYNPPPNYAKVTDARFEEYRMQFGTDCWELDALEPRVISDLIEAEIETMRDPESWDERIEYEQAVRSNIASITTDLEDEGL